MDDLQKTVIRHKHVHGRKKKLFTTGNIIKFAAVVLFLAFTAFIIADPSIGFYASLYTVLLYLVAICGFLLILVFVFFGFVIKFFQFVEKIFQNRK